MLERKKKNLTTIINVSIRWLVKDVVKDNTTNIEQCFLCEFGLNSSSNNTIYYVCVYIFLI